MQPTAIVSRDRRVRHYALKLILQGRVLFMFFEIHLAMTKCVGDAIWTRTLSKPSLILIPTRSEVVWKAIHFHGMNDIPFLGWLASHQSLLRWIVCTWWVHRLWYQHASEISTWGFESGDIGSGVFSRHCGDIWQPVWHFLLLCQPCSDRFLALVLQDANPFSNISHIQPF